MEKSTDVILTKVSDHARNSMGSKCENGLTIGRTQIGWSQWTLVYGKDANRKSRTLHCDEKTAEYEKGLVKGVE